MPWRRKVLIYSVVCNGIALILVLFLLVLRPLFKAFNFHISYSTRLQIEYGLANHPIFMPIPTFFFRHGNDCQFSSLPEAKTKQDT